GGSAVLAAELGDPVPEGGRPAQLQACLFQVPCHVCRRPARRRHAVPVREHAQGCRHIPDRPPPPCPASAASLAASRCGRKIARVTANAAVTSRTSTVPAAAA